MKKNHPRVSIVTPSLNQREFITQTIESIHTQAYPNIEHIVMDGGSTDGTVLLLKKIKHPISWESAVDAGQSAALNRGFSRASGQICAYLNSDDYYVPGAISKVMDVFKTYPEVHWVVGDCRIVDHQGREMHSFVRKLKAWIRRHYRPWLLFVLNPFPQPAVFWRAKSASVVGKFDTHLRFTMDFDYWHRFQREYGKPFFIHTPLAAFRIHSQSKGKTQYRLQFEEELHVARRYQTNYWLRALHNGMVKCILLAYGIVK